MADKPIRIITRGADSGSCRSVNRAHLDAFQNGMMRNTSLMIPAPAFEEAVEMFKDLPGLCVGSHGAITDEWNEVRWGPVLGPEKVPSLVMDDGTFYKTTQELWANKPDFNEIAAELKAQIDLARSCGVKVDYLDGHMGYRWFDGLAEVLDELCEKEGILRGEHVNRQCERLSQVSLDVADPIEELVARLEATEPGKTYLMVTHPGYDDDELKAMTYGDNPPGEIARQRNWQRLMFMDPRVVECFERKGIEAIRYTEF